MVNRDISFSEDFYGNTFNEKRGRILSVVGKKVFGKCSNMSYKVDIYLVRNDDNSIVLVKANNITAVHN